MLRPRVGGGVLTCACLVINTVCHVIKYLFYPLAGVQGAGAYPRHGRGTSGTGWQLFEGPVEDNNHSHLHL